jgi:glycosyltransferase involved in cell wall biosynthesis
MEELQHIVLLCSRLDQPGGTERATVNLANLLARHWYKVTLAVLDETASSFYMVDPAVQRVHRNLHFGITTKGNTISRKLDLYRHIRQLKKLIAALKADVVIGTEYHFSISAWLAARRMPVRVFAWEHHHIHWLKKNRFWSILFRSIYPKLDAVVCQNEREKSFHAAFGCDATVIPYSIDKTSGEHAALDQKNLITVGWLILRKGADLIPQVARKIFQHHPDWRWTVIGSGELSGSLQAKIKNLHLENNLFLQSPESQDLTSFYLSASIYVMLSRSECLPMVLLEAASYGLPSVAFDCPTGPAEIIQTGRDGLIVPMEDVDGLSAAILQLIENENLRKQMGHSALNDSHRYAPETVYGLWRKLLEE